MSSTPLIRLATSADAAQVQAIYAPFVENSVISFEFETPSVEEMRRRMDETLRQFPYLVCEHHGEVAGYVYAGLHSERAAYMWSTDVTVYIHPRCHRCGVGRALYTSLFQILRLQGYVNAYAGVTLPNPGSVGLHESLGFTSVGVYVAVGYKFGAWHDVGWWQMALRERVASPAAPLSLDEVRQSPAWPRAMDAGLPILGL